jgi:hypothetical protein
VRGHDGASLHATSGARVILHAEKTTSHQLIFRVQNVLPAHLEGSENSGDLGQENLSWSTRLSPL